MVPLEMFGSDNHTALIETRLVYQTAADFHSPTRVENQPFAFAGAPQMMKMSVVNIRICVFVQRLK